uniref:Uncharacterized protein n=1 Tax=Arundo donax TaxID=35708 RepID=A0A0A9B6Y9_ARUDO
MINNCVHAVHKLSFLHSKFQLVRISNFKYHKCLIPAPLFT